MEAWSAVKFIYELNSTFGARAYVRNVLGLRKADEKKDYIRISEAIARADKKINAYQAILEKARQEAILFEKQEEELQLKKAEELKAQQAKYDELLRAFVAEEEKAYLDSKKKCQAKQKKTVEPKVAEIAEVAKAETVSAANQTVTLFKPAPKPSLYDQMLKETIQYYDSNNDVIKSLPVFNNNMNAIMAQASSPTDFDRVQSAAMLGDAQLRCLCHYITTNRLTEENIDEADAYYKTGVECFEKAFSLIKDWRETEKEDEKEDREECILAIKMAFEKMQKIFDKHLKDLLEQKKNDEEELNKLLKQVKTDNREHKQFRRKVIRAQGYDAWCKPKPEGYISPYQQKVITRDKRIRVLKNKIQEESIPCKKAEEILTNHQIMHNKLGELANAKQVRPIVRK